MLARVAQRDRGKWVTLLHNEVEEARRQAFNSQPYDWVGNPQHTALSGAHNVLFMACCERLAFAATTIALYGFVSDILGWGDLFGGSAPQMVMYSFYSTVCATSLLGGHMADSFFGKYCCIVYAFFAYFVGLVFLFFSSLPCSFAKYPEQPWPGFAIPGFTIGLVFFALGAGIMLPNVASFLPDQYAAAGEFRLENIYSRLYFWNALGSILGMCVSPLLSGLQSKQSTTGSTYQMDTSYWAAFLYSLLALTLSLFLFIGHRSQYTFPERHARGMVHVKQVILSAIRGRTAYEYLAPCEHWLDYALPEYGEQVVEDVKKILKVCAVLVVCPFYIVAYVRIRDTCALFAELLHSPVHLTPVELFSANATLVAIFILLWPWLRSCFKQCHRPGPIARVAVGMFLAGICILGSAEVKRILNSGQDLLRDLDNSALLMSLLAIPFALTALSEMFTMIGLYEFIYGQAPTSVKSMMLALMFLTIGLGHFFAFVLNHVVVAMKYDDVLVMLVEGGTAIFMSIVVYFCFRHYGVNTNSGNEPSPPSWAFPNAP